VKWRNPFSIFAQLDRIERKVDHVSSQEQELDAALSELAGKVDSLVTAVDALIARIPPTTATDLSDEIAAVRAAAGEVQTVTETADAAEQPPTP
jgi:prefoldin subunit 5